MPGDKEIADFYPEQYWWNSAKPGALTRLESIYRKLALRGHVSFIQRAAGARRGADLLDVGCGSGTLLGLLKKRGFHSTGLDFSAEAADVAERENGVRVIVGSLKQAALPERSFDIVTLFHVMEHVTDPRQVLSEVSRILKSDGVLVLQVPNIDSLQFRAFGAKWYGLDIPRHVIDYSRKAITGLLNDCGFAPVRIKHFNLRDNAPALVSSLFPSLDPVSRGVRQRKHRVRDSTIAAWSRRLAYLFLVVCAYPFVILESAFGRGATVMIEARKRAL
jgi:2-polyprenyl-3-methyl-5-hydroxy-6-metoxy-1,4-benzoquinol methylase